MDKETLRREKQEVGEKIFKSPIGKELLKQYKQLISMAIGKDIEKCSAQELILMEKTIWMVGRFYHRSLQDFSFEMKTLVCCVEWLIDQKKQNEGIPSPFQAQN